MKNIPVVHGNFIDSINYSELIKQQANTVSSHEVVNSDVKTSGAKTKKIFKRRKNG